MSLFYKPHTATVTQVGELTSSGEIVGYTDLIPTVSVAGQLTEKTPQQALEMFGIDVQFPAVWLCDLGDADSIQVGFRMSVNSREYIIVAGPQRMDAEPITSHARYLVRRYEE